MGYVQRGSSPNESTLTAFRLLLSTSELTCVCELCEIEVSEGGERETLALVRKPGYRPKFFP